MMTKYPYLYWMRSAIAYLFEFHGEDFISDTLCAFLIQSHASSIGQALIEQQLAWHPFRLQLMPVINKLVSSIWYNFVNSCVLRPSQGCSLSSMPLPPEIATVCLRVHGHVERSYVAVETLYPHQRRLMTGWEHEDTSR